MLNWIRKRMKRNQRGFTLIELIVVIAILGVLAAIAVPNVTGAISKARTGSDIATATTIAHAAERYLAEHPDASDTTTNLAGAVDDNNVLVTEDYLDRTPVAQDKSNSHAYFYLTLSSNSGSAGGYKVEVYYADDNKNKIDSPKLYPQQ